MRYVMILCDDDLDLKKIQIWIAKNAKFNSEVWARAGLSLW